MFGGYEAKEATPFTEILDCGKVQTHDYAKITRIKPNRPSKLFSNHAPEHALYIMRIIFLFQMIQDERPTGYTRSADSQTITSTHGHWLGVDFTLQATRTASDVSG